MEAIFLHYYGELFSFWVHIILNVSIFKFALSLKNFKIYQSGLSVQRAST